MTIKKETEIIKGVTKVGTSTTNTSVAIKLTVPKDIVDAMQLKKGEQLLFEYSNGEITIKRL